MQCARSCLVVEGKAGVELVARHRQDEDERIGKVQLAPGADRVQPLDHVGLRAEHGASRVQDAAAPEVEPGAVELATLEGARPGALYEPVFWVSTHGPW